MSAAEQLRVDVGADGFSMPEEGDFVNAVIFAHGGYARRAVAELMLDADFLRGQLYSASAA